MEQYELIVPPNDDQNHINKAKVFLNEMKALELINEDEDEFLDSRKPTDVVETIQQI